jgi:hypothetical protein
MLYETLWVLRGRIDKNMSLHVAFYLYLQEVGWRKAGYLFIYLFIYL